MGAELLSRAMSGPFVSGRYPRTPANRRAGIVAALIVYMCAGAFAHVSEPQLTGDEPHYLVYATSLGRGWGVDLERAYRLPNHRSFFPGTLDQHADVSPRKGRLVTWHGVGLAALLAPVATRPQKPETFRAASAVLAAALAYNLVQLLAALCAVTPLVAAGAVVAVMVSPPLVFYATQIFPEVVAGLLVVVSLRCLNSSRLGARRFTLAALAACLLPWFNLRYLTLTASLGVAIAVSAWMAGEGNGMRRLTQTLRVLAGAILTGAVVGGALIAFNFELYGALVAPSRGTTGYFSLANLYGYGLGGVIGFPSGLLALAPILLVALLAVPMSARVIGWRGVAAGLFIATAYCGFNGYFGSPGWSPAGRYFVSVVPLLALPLAVAWAHSGGVVKTVCVVAFALSALTSIDAVLHFGELYTANRRNFHVMHATAALWPETIAPYFGSLDQPAAAIQHETGSLERIDGVEYLVAREGRDAPGALLSSPGVPLLNGRYRASFELFTEASEPGLEPLTAEVALDGAPVAVATVSFPGQGRLTVAPTLEFETRTGGATQLRLHYGGHGTVGILKTSAQIVSSLPARNAATERIKSAAWVVGLIAVASIWRRRAVYASTPA